MKNSKYFIISLVVVLIDQISKISIQSFFLKHPEINTIPILGDLLRLTYVQNTGAAFSFSLGSIVLNRIVFSLITIIASIMIIRIVQMSNSKIQNICFSMILGGAVGNLIDRLFRGGVVDFLDSDFPDFIMERWPIFNVADSSVVVALTILIIYYIFFEKKEKDGEI